MTTKKSPTAGAEPKGGATPSDASAGAPSNFIRDIILADQKSNRYGGRVATRFPPEPNGYLHIGHAKAICIDFGLAKELGGSTNLRYDDTNPTTEDVEYVNAIEEDIRWLGWKWQELHYASDYFEHCYETAVKLIKKGKAYVDSLKEDEIREYRGDYFKKGKESPYRNRSVEENLDLFERMRKGEFKEGEHVLRAKIDLSSQNMNLRDPILYRIRYAPHHRTGTKWCIYPMYDYAHPLSDAVEKITHSICTLEFEAHRPLYDWCIRESESWPSQQIEFARLNLTFTVMSKRKLLQLVKEKLVSGWDDPRMPTLAGMRRRGFTPESIRTFCERIGVSKADSVVDVGLLEHCLREDLNHRCPRVMGVLKPLKLVIDNFPEGEVRELEAPLHPEDPAHGSRKLPFAKVLYIERDDFREDPPKEWFRLAPGREVRLRYACLVKCVDVVKDANGEVTELHCTLDPQSWGGTSPDGRVVRGTLHWVAAAHAVPAEVRVYDRLFATENPGTDENKSFLEEINPSSLETLSGCLVEPVLPKLIAGDALAKGVFADGRVRVQFERLGYFCVDPDTKPGKLVFNRTVTLKDSWAKIEAKAGDKKADKAKGGKQPATKATQAPTAPLAAASKSAAAPQPAATPATTAAAAAATGPAPVAAEITIDDFGKVDLRVGIVRQAETLADAKKLLKLQVDLGEGRLRQIFAGIRAYYPDPAALVGKRVIVVANLKPRQMKWGISEGMILAAGGTDRPHRVATFDEEGPAPGDRIG